MAYDWTKNSEGGQAEKIPNGTHDLEIVRIIRGTKSKNFESRSGDPQIMVVFADDRGREAAQMYTLSKKAGWTLAILLGRCGIDLEKMKADGIEPEHFANEKYAVSMLVGLKCRAEVTWEEGDDGKQYADVQPLKVEGQVRDKVLQPVATADTWGGRGPLKEEDIPF